MENYPNLCCGNWVYDDVQIGENVSIEDPEHTSIGKGTRIDGGVAIYSGVSIGENCHIQANVVLGSKGFIYHVKPNLLERELTEGKTIIEDNVDIGANCTIDSGRNQTILRKNCKLDNLIQIAHDCDIGERVLIAAGTILGGHVTIGNNTRLGLNCTIKNRVTIGQNCFIGMGVNIIKSISDSFKFTLVTEQFINRK